MLHIMIRFILSFVMILGFLGMIFSMFLQNEAKANDLNKKELDLIILEKVKNKIESEKHEYEKLSKKVMAQELKHRSYAEELVKIIENNIDKNIAHAIKDHKPTDDILGEFEQIRKSITNKNNCNAISKEGFKIFISSSMPRELIKNFDFIARKIGAKLVIRGLINNSFKDTIIYIKEANDQGMIIDVDPLPFDEFKINLVPSFVMSDGENFDKLVGNVSIIYALEQFVENGDLAEKAKVYLERLNEKAS